MTKKSYKNLTALSAQLFLGTALVAGSAHAETFTVNNAGNALTQVHTNAQIANANLEADGTSHTLYFTHGAGDMTAGAALTPFAKTQTITFTADTAMDFITTGFAGIDGPINLAIGGSSLITFTTDTPHTYTGSTTVGGSAGLTLSNTANILPTGTNLSVVGTATFTTAAAQTVNSLTINGSSTAATTTLGGALTVTTDLTVTKGTLTAGAHAVDVSNGTLTLTDGSITGSANVTAKHLNVAAGKTLTNTGAVVSASNGTVAGVLAGTGALTKTHDADTDNTLTLSGANTFTGDVTINGGKLVSSHKTGLGAVATNVNFANNAEDKVLQIDTEDQTDKTGTLALNGTGKITINAVKNIAFTRAMTHGASTEFTKTGVGKLSIGNTTAATTTDYQGTAKVEQGILEINAGANFTHLAVDVSEDATLQGSGTVAGAVTVSGKIMPGQGSVPSAGGVTLTVGSLELTHDEASIEIHATKAAASTPVFNKLVVTGALTGASKGTLDFVVGDGVTLGSDGMTLDQIITADSVASDTAAFTTEADVNAFLKNKLARVVNEKHLLSNVELTATLNGTRPELSAKITDLSNSLNERFDDVDLANEFLRDYVVAGLNDANNVAQFNSSVVATSSTTGTGYVSNEQASDKVRLAVADLMLLGKYDKAAASKALSQISGVANRSSMEASTAAMNAVSGAVSSHVSAALSGSAAGSSPSALAGNSFARVDGQLARLADSGLAAGCGVDEVLENGAWVKAFGGWENLSNDGAKHPGHRTTVAGAAFGFDHYFTPELLAGIAVSYARLNTKVNNGLGDSHADSYSATLYAGAKFDELTVDGSLMVASNHYTMNRSTVAHAVGTQSVSGQTATAKPKSFDFGAHLGASYLIQTPSIDVTPFASIDYRNASFDSYDESGLTGINVINALHVDKVRLQVFTPKAGVVLSKALAMAGGSWTPALTLGWKAFMPMGSNSAMTKIQGFVNSFEAKNLVKTRHMAVAGLGVALDMKNGWNVNFGYEGAYNNKLNTHDFMVKVGKRF